MFRATLAAVCVLLFAALCFGASIGVDDNDGAHSGEKNGIPLDDNSKETGKKFFCSKLFLDLKFYLEIVVQWNCVWVNWLNVRCSF